MTCRGSPARCRLEEGSCPLHDMELGSSTFVVPGTAGGMRKTVIA